jgi:LPS-assembly lipoprotein
MWFSDVIPATAGIQKIVRACVWIPAFAGMTLASCGFHLRGEPEVGIRKLYISAAVPSSVQTDVKRLLANGPTRLVNTAPEAEAQLRILNEGREQTVYTITGSGRVYEYQLRLFVRYELTVPGREEPVIAPTDIEARRLITYSATAPTAKEAEAQQIYKDMQAEIAQAILRHVAAMTRAAQAQG